MTIVHARQGGVLQGAGVEFVFHVVIDGVGGVVLLPVEFYAVGPGLVSHATGGDEAAQVETPVLVTHIGVAGSGAEFQVIGEVVAEVVAEDELVTLVVVPPRVAGEKVPVDPLAVGACLLYTSPSPRDS